MIRRPRTDLALVVGVLVGANVALHAPGVPWPIEWAFGVPLLVALPGYAVVAALFPEAPGRSVSGRPDAPDWAVRAALSLVLSAVVVAVVGVLLSARGTLRLTPAVLLVSAVTLAGVATAAVRRWELPADRRADPVAGASLRAVTDGFGTSGVQTLVLVVAGIALVGSLAVAGGTPSSGDPYSEVYLQGDIGDSTENGTGTLVADETNVVRLGIENHEGAATSYRVVVQLQRVGTNGTVDDQQRLDSFRVRLAAGEVAVYERGLVPSMSGDRLRLQTLVYKDEAGENSEDETADLSLRRWVVVVEGRSA